MRTVNTLKDFNKSLGEHSYSREYEDGSFAAWMSNDYGSYLNRYL